MSVGVRTAIPAMVQVDSAGSIRLNGFESRPRIIKGGTPCGFQVMVHVAIASLSVRDFASGDSESQEPHAHFPERQQHLNGRGLIGVPLHPVRGLNSIRRPMLEVVGNLDGIALTGR